MNKANHIQLNFTDESILLSQSDFWYFKNLLNKISYYFSSNQNKTNNVLVKIPGSGKYKCVNISSFNNIKDQMEYHLNKYRDNYQLY